MHTILKPISVMLKDAKSLRGSLPTQHVMAGKALLLTPDLRRSHVAGDDRPKHFQPTTRRSILSRRKSELVDRALTVVVPLWSLKNEGKGSLITTIRRRSCLLM